MNMIPTGAFLTEMDASEKKETLAEQFVSIWEKKNSKIARAGGVSLMALSLAACGSSSDDTAATDTPAAETPAEETPAAETPAEETPAEEEVVEEVTPVVTELAVSSLTADTTMKTTDDLDGGAGTADELSLSLSADFAGFVVDTDAADTGSMVGYEVVSLSADSLARSFDATGVSGVETYKVDGSNGGVVSIADSADLAAIELSNIASGAFSITYAAPTGGTSPVAGTADTLSLTVEGLGSATADIAITAAGVETLAVTSNAAASAAGATNYLDTSGVAAASVTVAGAADVDFGAVSTSTTSFDASAVTGAVTASLTKAGADALATIKTGSGDDSVTVNANDLVATGTVEMGAGDDTFTMSSSAAETLELNMSGAETMVVSGLGAATTLSLANTTDLDTFVAKDAAGTANYTAATTIVNASGAQNFDLEGSTAGSFSTDTSGAVDIDITAVGTAKLGSEDTVTTTFTAAKASSLDISVGNFNETTGAISAAKATSVTVVSGTTDQSAMTITAAKGETWDITSGGDADYTGSTMSGAKSVTVDSTGTTELPALAALNVATLSGAGADAAIDITADIGAADLANDIAITATGLKSGLDLDGTVGDVGTIKSAGKVTIDAGGVTGTTTIGNITATGAASVTTGAKAAVVGTIDASAVTLDVSNSSSVTSVGQITTGSTATVTSNSVTSMGTLNIVGDKTSLTATLTGSLGNDDYNLSNSTAAGFTGFTVSGDLGVGTDQIDIAVADATAVASETPSQTVDITGVKNASVLINLADQTATDTLVIKGSKESTVTDTLDINTAGEQLDDLTVTDIDEITHDAATLKAAAVSGQTIEWNAGGANDVITLTGTGAADTISLANFTNASGNATNFTVNGGDKADTITGSDFIDILNGGAGGDTLNGGDGADTITGGAGNDTMSGGDDTAADVFTLAASGTSTAASATSFAGANVAAGDTFTFANGVDFITDFTAGTDDLNVTTGGAVTNLVGESATAALTNDENHVAYGTWNADDKVFTVAAAFNATSAKDALVVEGDGTLTLANSTGFVVLDDLSAALVGGDLI